MILAQDTQTAVNKSTAVSLAAVIGLYGPTVLTALSIVYVSMQIFFMVRDKVYRPWKAKREQEKQGSDQ